MGLQSLINGQSPGGKLELPPGEFFRQIIVDRPLTIVGRGASTWIGSRTSPTISITSPGVVLQQLMVEATGGPEYVAIEALPGTDPVLRDVIVKGLASGVPSQNIIDSTATKNERPNRISFLPPPPISPSVSEPVQPQYAAPSEGANAQPHSSPMISQSASIAQGTGAPSSSVPLQSPSSWEAVLSRFGWKIGVVVLIIFFGVLLLLQYNERQTPFAGLLEGQRRETERALEKIKELENREKRQSEALAREKREKDDALVRTGGLERERDQALKKARDLEQELLKLKNQLKSTIQERDQAVRTSRQLEQQQIVRERPTGQQKLANPIEVLQKLKRDKEAADSARDLNELGRMAAAGNAAAQFQIGIYYYWGRSYGYGSGPTGISFPQNDSEAVGWLQRAARQGHEEAKTFLKKLGSSW